MKLRRDGSQQGLGGVRRRGRRDRSNGLRGTSLHRPEWGLLADACAPYDSSYVTNLKHYS